MTIEEKIRILLAYRGVPQYQLAKLIGTTPSNLNQKIKKDTLTQNDLRKIAEALGCRWEAYFELEDGTRI